MTSAPLPHVDYELGSINDPHKPTAYQWGVSDYWRGVEACRYPIGSKKESDWLAGYNDAKRDAET